MWPEEYSWATHEKEAPPFGTVWRDPAGVLPSELSQREKDKYSMWDLKPGTRGNRVDGGYQGQMDGEMGRWWSKGINF